MESIDAEFVVPTPSDLIYKFEGTVHLISEGEITRRIPLEYENTMWGGCTLAKGTITGMIIYSGIDSKLMMNSKEAELKRSLVTDELNTYSKILFVIMVILSLGVMYMRGSTNNFFVHTFRYILLLSTIIPISMKVNHDISRLYYSARINSDVEIQGCQARNSNVCEDLGRIEYFLTDKTGTLTKNIMVMRQIFISDLGVLKEEDFKRQLASRGNLESLREFCNCMMVCHSVSPGKDESGKRMLDSSSPDEISFISLMERDGFKLIGKDDQQVTYIDELGNQQKYEILATFPFTSERKRMGLICRKQNDSKLIFYLKGADSIMKPKLKQQSQNIMMANAEELSSQGLRTLALGKRILSQSEYDTWKVKYDAACASLKRRNEKVEEAIELIEKDLDFIGVSEE